MNCWSWHNTTIRGRCPAPLSLCRATAMNSSHIIYWLDLAWPTSYICYNILHLYKVTFLAAMNSSHIIYWSDLAGSGGQPLTFVAICYKVLSLVTQLPQSLAKQCITFGCKCNGLICSIVMADHLSWNTLDQKTAMIVKVKLEYCSTKDIHYNVQYINFYYR